MKVKFNYEEIVEAKKYLSPLCFGGIYNAIAFIMRKLNDNASDRWALAVLHVLQKGYVEDMGYLSLPKTVDCINSAFDTDNMKITVWTDHYDNDNGTDDYYSVIDVMRYNGTVEDGRQSGWFDDDGEWREEDVNLGIEYRCYVVDCLNEAIR